MCAEENQERATLNIKSKEAVLFREPSENKYLRDLSKVCYTGSLPFCLHFAMLKPMQLAQC